MKAKSTVIFLSSGLSPTVSPLCLWNGHNRGHAYEFSKMEKFELIHGLLRALKHMLLYSLLKSFCTLFISTCLLTKAIQVIFFNCLVFHTTFLWLVYLLTHWKIASCNGEQRLRGSCFHNACRYT